jgi:hypothetical protein
VDIACSASGSTSDGETSASNSEAATNTKNALYLKQDVRHCYLFKTWLYFVFHRALMSMSFSPSWSILAVQPVDTTMHTSSKEIYFTYNPSHYCLITGLLPMVDGTASMTSMYLQLVLFKRTMSCLLNQSFHRLQMTTSRKHTEAQTTQKDLTSLHLLTQGFFSHLSSSSIKYI